MFQGQIGWIKKRDTAPADKVSYAGWAQKLRDDASGTTYYYCMDKDLRLSTMEVDDSMMNKHPEYPYEVVLVVPTSAQAKNTHVDDNMVGIVCMQQLKDVISQMQEARNAKVKELNEALKMQREIDEMGTKIAELVSAYNIACRNGSMPEFYYAYGKHNATSREYCWRIPSKLKDVVKPGVTAVVQTRDGSDRCVVTRVEVSPQYLNHKLVISVEGETQPAA